MSFHSRGTNAAVSHDATDTNDGPLSLIAPPSQAQSCSGTGGTQAKTWCDTSLAGIRQFFNVIPGSTSFSIKEPLNQFANASEYWCPNNVGAAPVAGASCLGQGYLRDGQTCTQTPSYAYSPNLLKLITPEIDAMCPKSFARNSKKLFIFSDGICGSTCSNFGKQVRCAMAASLCLCA